MKSIKPKLKGKASASTRLDPSPVDDASLEPFLQMLSAAGSDPRLLINAEVVERLKTGALGEALAFLAAHVRGREEVRKARIMIADAGAEVNPHMVELERLERRVKSARTAVEVARRAREEKRARQEELEKERKALEGRLRRERELDVLLRALEAREGVRIKRIIEVEELVNKLSKEVRTARKDGRLDPPPEDKVTPIELTPLKRWRPRCTKETIAKLHACHIRLKADCSTEAQIHARKEAEELLENVVRSSFQKKLTENEMQEILDTCKRAAQERAKRRWMGRTSSGHDVDWEGLENKAHQVRNKESQVKTLNEAVVAKMTLLEKYLHVVNTFRGQNVDAIKKSLKEDEEGTKGYIETAKSALTQSCVAREQETTSRDGSSEQLERELRRCYEIEGFLNRLSAPKRAERDAEIIAKYKRDRENTEKRVVTLLERKVGKGKLGMQVAQEIEVLCAEARGLLSG